MCDKYSERLEAMIQECCGEPQGAYDATDFDCIAFINNVIPDIVSLDGLHSIIGEYGQTLEKTNSEMHQVVTKMVTAKQGIGKGPSAESIDEIYYSLNNIATQSRESTDLVDKLIKDTSKLNTVKQNICKTITYCKKVQTLMSLFDMVEGVLGISTKCNSAKPSMLISEGVVDVADKKGSPIDVRVEDILAPSLVLADSISFFQLQEPEALEGTGLIERYKVVRKKVYKVAKKILSYCSKKIINPFTLINTKGIAAQAASMNSPNAMEPLNVEAVPVQAKTREEAYINDIFSDTGSYGFSAHSISDTNASSHDRSVFYIDPTKYHEESETTEANDEYNLINANPLTQEEKQRLSAAVQLVCTFDKDLLVKLVEHFLNEQISPYKTIFSSNTLIAGLKGVPLRYKWLRKYFTCVVDFYKVAFPPSWRVLDRFVVSWTTITSNDINNWLISNNIVSPDDNLTPEANKDFLNAILSTSDAVDYLERMFWPDPIYQSIMQAYNRREEEEFSASPEGKMITTLREMNGEGEKYEAVIEKYKKKFKEEKEEKEKEEASLNGIKNVTETQQDTSVSPLPSFNTDFSFRQTLNSMFVNLLGIYVKNEVASLFALVHQLSKADDMKKAIAQTMNAMNQALKDYKSAEQFNTLSSMRFPCINITSATLPSTTKLLVLIKEATKRCAKISNQNSLLQLYKALDKVFFRYARCLKHKLQPVLSSIENYKPTVGIVKPLSIIYGGTDESVEIPPLFNVNYPVVQSTPEAIVTDVIVIQSAEYVITNIKTLEESIKALIDPNLKEVIDLTPSQSHFKDVQLKAFKCFTAGGLAQCEKAFEPWFKQHEEESKTITSTPVAEAKTTKERQLIITPCTRRACNILTGSLKRIKVSFPREYNKVVCEIYAVGLLNIFARTIFSHPPITPHQFVAAKMDYELILETLDVLQDISGTRSTSIRQLKQSNVLSATFDIITASTEITVNGTPIRAYDGVQYHPSIGKAEFVCKNLPQNYFKLFVKSNLTNPQHALFWFKDFSKIIMKRTSMVRKKMKSEVVVLITPYLTSALQPQGVQTPTSAAKQANSRATALVDKIGKGIGKVQTRVMEELKK